MFGSEAIPKTIEKKTKKAQRAFCLNIPMLLCGKTTKNIGSDFEK
jgi:hypothetical protein